jgi:YD repeat-containing protein
MKKLSTVLLFVFSQLYIIAYAQLDIAFQNTEPPLPTWKTYEFIKYGKIGTSLYTGTVNHTIPFYTYKDSDFEIPLSFNYASNGFRTNSQIENLGHGWILNVGGLITREIKGFPDEVSKFILSPYGAGRDVRGFYYIYKNKINQSLFNLNVCVNSSGNLLFVYETDSKESYDVEPDIFHFNFLGYSGSFHLWYNGEIKTFNVTGASAGVRVFVSDEMDYFSIITPDGYTYSFGGYTSEDNSEEYLDEMDNFSNKICTTISWKLRTITAPNGRIVNFNYGIRWHSYVNRNIRYIPKTNNYQMFCSFDDRPQISDFSLLNMDKVMNPPLSSITIEGDTIIKFSHTISNTEKYIYKGSIKDNAAKNTALLNRIEVLYDNVPIRKCEITYKWSKKNPGTGATGNIIPFLDSIKINGDEAYTFDYYDIVDKELPYLGSFSFDHWGYYNGKNDYLPPIDVTDSLTYDSNHNEILNTNIKNPNATYARRGMLKRITYPTGGYTEFYYEAHDYSMKIIRNSQTLFKPELIPTANKETTGGLRIRKIINYTTNGVVVDSIAYYYQDDDNNNSTGIQINVPRYGIEYHAFTDNEVQKKVKFYSSSNDIYAYYKTHVEYSRVTEKRSDNSTIDYYFTSNLEYPDEFDASHYVSQPVPTYLELGGQYTFMNFSIKGDNNNLIANILTPLVSNQYKRGKLWKTKIRDAKGMLLKQEITKYDFSLVSQIRIPKIVGEKWRYIERKEYSIHATKATIFDYYHNGQVERETEFTYNTEGQIIATLTKRSNSDTLLTHYLYVTDITPESTNEVYKNMLSKNIINYPIQEITYLKKGNINTQISGKKYTYLNPNSSKAQLIRLAKTETWNRDETWTEDIRYNIYDRFGNLLESEDKNGIKTTYIWGYRGLYRIAKIINASYQEIKNALNYTDDNINMLAKQDKPDVSWIRNKLATYFNNKLVLSTTYTYQPLIGMTSQTDPNGITTYYKYDEFNRLKIERDHEGNVLKQYEYHYNKK